jgi:hypothetical protein
MAEFFADMRSWLDHHCIMPAEFRGITLANKSGVFEVLFDNPRDGLLFGRRFGARPISSVPAHIASRRSISATTSPIDQRQASILSSMMGHIGSLLWTRARTYQSAQRATNQGEASPIASSI